MQMPRAPSSGGSCIVQTDGRRNWMGTKPIGYVVGFRRLKGLCLECHSEEGSYEESGVGFQRAQDSPVTPDLSLRSW